MTNEKEGVVSFKCIVLRELFFNETSNYGVYRARTDVCLAYAEPATFDGGTETGYTVILAGNTQRLTPGTKYEVKAEAKYNAKRSSWSYDIGMAVPLVPRGQNDSITYLKTILTKKQAESLIAVYPNIVSEVTGGTDHVDVSKVNGIGEKTWSRLRNKIINNFALSDLLSALGSYGLSADTIKSIAAHSKNPSLMKAEILANPYCITRIRGFGFARADAVAYKIDPSLLVSNKRMFAFIRHYLNEAQENEGHTWVPEKEIRKAVAQNIPQCMELYNEFVKDPFSVNEDVRWLYFEDGIMAINALRRCEYAIHERLVRLNDVPFTGHFNADDGIMKAEKRLGYSLSEEQKNVVRSIADSNVVIFTGSAGSGKTSTATAILNAFMPDCKIACCSLSAKAAIRIREATGYKASTIHMLLGVSEKGFTHNRDNPLVHNVVFIDEASMVDVRTFYALLDAVPDGAKVIICGDRAQLPPIGAGSVFADLLDLREEFGSIALKKVHRQAEKSGILTDANIIRGGIMPFRIEGSHASSGDMKDMLYIFKDDPYAIQDTVVGYFNRIADKYGADNVVVAVPRREEVVNSAEQLNSRIQHSLFEGTDTPCVVMGNKRFYEGDRVLQTKNNYSKNVFNGEVGRISKVYSHADQDEALFNVEFPTSDGSGSKKVDYTRSDAEDLMLGYAITVHKLQGSEYPYVIVDVDRSHYILLDNTLLYTAITRAKKKCLLVGEPSAFANAIRKNHASKRRTFLKIIHKQNLEERDESN